MDSHRPNALAGCRDTSLSIGRESNKLDEILKMGVVGDIWREAFRRLCPHGLIPSPTTCITSCLIYNKLQKSYTENPFFLLVALPSHRLWLVLSFYPQTYVSAAHREHLHLFPAKLGLTNKTPLRMTADQCSLPAKFTVFYPASSTP